MSRHQLQPKLVLAQPWPALGGRWLSHPHGSWLLPKAGPRPLSSKAGQNLPLGNEPGARVPTTISASDLSTSGREPSGNRVLTAPENRIAAKSINM